MIIVFNGNTEDLLKCLGEDDYNELNNLLQLSVVGEKSK